MASPPFGIGLWSNIFQGHFPARQANHGETGHFVSSRGRGMQRVNRQMTQFQLQRQTNRHVQGKCATSPQRRALTLLLAGVTMGGAPLVSADEGGVAFWLSGQFSSFSAVPAEPGTSVALIPYYTNGNSGNTRTFVRQGRLSAGGRGNPMARPRIDSRRRLVDRQADAGKRHWTLVQSRSSSGRVGDVRRAENHV